MPGRLENVRLMVKSSMRAGVFCVVRPAVCSSMGIFMLREEKHSIFRHFLEQTNKKV